MKSQGTPAFRGILGILKPAQECEREAWETYGEIRRKLPSQKPR